ncbi:hypothetical protein IMCC26256_119 [Actinobacteria bacterium IMCC26256]|jgi:hypothetical protein|nr:hypothetical protein IMCC26256_119 [Actinobacteria bacterium IMCC26256]
MLRRPSGRLASRNGPMESCVVMLKAMRASRAFRRSLIVVVVAAVAGALVRVQGKGSVAPTIGGWRQLSGPHFR